MSVFEWFGVGVGCAAALWWWRFLTKWCTFYDDPKFDPFHLRSDAEPAKDGPHTGPGFVLGTFCWALTPVWLPFYACWVIGPACSRAADRMGKSDALLSARDAYLRMLGGPDRVR